MTSSWLEVPSHPADTPGDLSQEEQDRVSRWKKLLDGGLFQPLQALSDYLQSHVVARVLSAQDAGQERSLIQCLEDAVERGHPAPAEEATRHLEEMRYEPKAGHRADAEFSPPEWTGSVGLGQLHFDPKYQIDPIPQDHQDKLRAKASKVPLGDSQEIEERQCLPLRVGIGICRVLDPKADDQKAQSEAAQLRGSLWQEAAAAQAHLGDPPTWISETEHFLRQNIVPSS